jgi:hypothetical protein
MKPRKYAIAICGKGAIGLITSDEQKLVHFSDGTSRMCWTGIHLTDKIRKFGSYWCSSKPEVIGYLDEMIPDHWLID